MKYHLGQEQSQKTQSQRVQIRTSRVGGPEIQLSKKPEIQKSRNPVTCHVNPGKNNESLSQGQ